MTEKKIGERGRERIEKAEKAIIGETYKMLIARIKKLAEHDLPVLFVGETGTGKEMFADLYIAGNIRRDPEQSKKIDCAGIPKHLLRSHIFGHVKGAFTDAVMDRPGLLQASDKGVLFLDEIGDAPDDFQAAILRVSEDHPFQKLGDSAKDIKVDVRIIAATNKPNTLRSDLLNRFQIFPLPPLQKNDIAALAEHFLGRLPKREILDSFFARKWPGNIRELKNECAKLKAEAETPEDLFPKDSDTEFPRDRILDAVRFQKQFTTWLKFVQPKIDQHHLDFRYQYFAESQKAAGDLHLEPMAKELFALFSGKKEWSDEKVSYILRDLSRVRNIDIFLRQFDTEMNIGHPSVNLDFKNAGRREKMELLKELDEKFHGNMRRMAMAKGLNYRTFQARVRRARSTFKQS